MLLEITAFLGVAVLTLFFFAETKGKSVLGVLGALALIILALYLWTDGIQTVESQTKLTNETQNYTFDYATNMTNVTVSRNESIVNGYEDVDFYTENKEFATLAILCVAVFMLFHYVLNTAQGR